MKLPKYFNRFFWLLFSSCEFILVLIAGGVFSYLIQSPFSVLNIIAPVIWVVLLNIQGSYKIGRSVPYFSTLKKAINSLFIFFSIFSIMGLFVFQINIDTTSAFIAVDVLMVLIITFRLAVHAALDRYRAYGGNIKRVAIVGYDSLGKGLYNLITSRPHFGYRTSGVYSHNTLKNNPDDVPYLGNIKEAIQSKSDAWDVIFVSDHIASKHKIALLDLADTHEIDIKLLPELPRTSERNFFISKFYHIPVINIKNLPLDNVINVAVKRVFDVVFSLGVVLFILSWLYPIIALIIKLESKGPVIFKQQREGEKGKSFMCFKFRTMQNNPEADHAWAKTNDPRLTKFGAFLRKTSLDELPQFFNVLLGDMSVVGPRPHPLKLNQEYKLKVEKFPKRHQFKPGITGLAQALGHRGTIVEPHQMSSRVRLDRFYFQNWSFVLDIKIIFLTVFGLANFRNSSAY